MQPYNCAGTTGVVWELIFEAMGTHQLLQVLQTRTSLSPGSLVCAWLMLELSVLSVGSAEGTKPHCQSDFTTGFSADFM